MNLAESLERWALEAPDRQSVLAGGIPLSYGRLNAWADDAARRLEQEGVGLGDRVVLLSPNHAGFLAFYFGALKLGAVPVAVNNSLTPAELTQILADSQPKVVASLRTGAELANLSSGLGFSLVNIDPDIPPECAGMSPTRGRRVARAMEASDLAVIVYTSGTTGHPKGVMLSHGNILTNIAAKRDLLGIRPDDRLLLFLPLFHCFGQNAIMNAAICAGAAVVLHSGFQWDAIVESMERDGVTMFFGVPATFVLLREAPLEKFRRVRLYFCAAATLPLTVELAWRERFGHAIQQGYGLTETSPFAAFNSGVRAGSIGQPIPGVAMKIVNPDTGRELPNGELGEIWIKGPNVMLGYWQRPEETRQVLVSGWFRTGDVGRRDRDGYFYYEDRLKDLINVGGEKVCPAEVEAVLRRHPAVADAAVFGVADEVMGEQVLAHVVTRPQCAFDGSELGDFCRRYLAPYKWPNRIATVDSLPRTPSGKVLKRVLRQAAARQQDRPPQGPPVCRMQTAFEVEHWLCDWLAGRLKSGGDEQAVDPSRSFADQGFSSLDLVMMTRELGVALDLELPVSLPWACPTPADTAARVEELIEERRGTVGQLAAIAGGTPESKELPAGRGDDYAGVGNAL